jgi:hypothetical protein
LGYRPQYEVHDIIDDLYEHRSAYGDYSSESFYNIKVFRKTFAR